MNRRLILTVATSMFAVLAMVGCSHPYYPPAGPPPPPAGPPAIVQLADHNGFETGRGDGQRDSVSGYPYSARRTRAYHQTPGYDANLGPFRLYQNSFRNAYLRGYDAGYYRR